MRTVLAAVFVTLVCSIPAVCETVDMKRPPLHMVLNDRGGTFALFTNVEGKDRSVFDNQSSSNANAFFVRVGTTVYRLRRNSITTVRTYQTGQGGYLHYVIANTLEAIVEFTFIESVYGGGADTFRVDLRAKNVSGKGETVSFKGIFDTAWGERDKSFFSTAALSHIGSEMKITNPAVHQWVKTSEYGRTMRLHFFGPGITTPETVTLANKDILTTSNAWDPGSTGERSFTSVLSVNNSAVEIRWPPTPLGHDEVMEITFYITVTSAASSPAVITYNPPGSAGMDSRNRALLPEDEKKPVNLTGTDTASQTPPVYPVPTLGRDTLASNPDSSGAVSAQAPYGGMPFPSVTRDPNSLPTPPLEALPFSVEKQHEEDIDYARNLIEQIRRLTTGPNGIQGMNQAEVARMNRELDAVLSRLGWKL